MMGKNWLFLLHINKYFYLFFFFTDLALMQRILIYL
jgi:hypothetical protein